MAEELLIPVGKYRRLTGDSEEFSCAESKRCNSKSDESGGTGKEGNSNNSGKEAVVCVIEHRSSEQDSLRGSDKVLGLQLHTDIHQTVSAGADVNSCVDIKIPDDELEDNVIDLDYLDEASFQLRIQEALLDTLPSDTQRSSLDSLTLANTTGPLHPFRLRSPMTDDVDITYNAMLQTRPKVDGRKVMDKCMEPEEIIQRIPTAFALDKISEVGRTSKQANDARQSDVVARSGQVKQVQLVE